MNSRELDERVRIELMAMEESIHPECRECTTVKRLVETAPPMSHLRKFTGSWYPLKRYKCTVDRCGREVPYRADYYQCTFRDDITQIKLHIFWRWGFLADAMRVKFVRFKNSYLDRW